MEENYCSDCGMEMDKNNIECKRDKEKEEKAIYGDVMNMETPRKLEILGRCL